MTNEIPMEHVQHFALIGMYHTIVVERQQSQMEKSQLQERLVEVENQNMKLQSDVQTLNLKVEEVENSFDYAMSGAKEDLIIKMLLKNGQKGLVELYHEWSEEMGEFFKTMSKTHPHLSTKEIISEYMAHKKLPKS